MPPRLICFDAGFTLIRPRQTMEERLAQVLLSHGHRAGSEDLRRAWEAADAWFWDEYHRPGNLTWARDGEIEATWRSYHRLMLASLGFADAGHELIQAVLDSQFAPDAWELYPDTIDALRLTHGAGAGPPAGAQRSGTRPHVGIISDWGSSLGATIRALGLNEWIDFVLASGAVNLAKPGPEFFRLACERAGVAPEAAVMIGDSYRADVVGARSAGMSAILLDRDGAAGDVEDVPVANDLVSAVELAMALPGAASAGPDGGGAARG
jgi:putative hydrolase of the HAD superfamily